MYCKHCGKEIDDNSKFCKFCGKSLEGSTTNLIGLPIRHFFISNKKTIIITLSLIFSLCIGWICYNNSDSVRIVGEWEREIRAGTEVWTFNDDGTFENKISGSLIEGGWSISDNILTIYFEAQGNDYKSRYDIVKLTSDKLVISSEETNQEEKYKRKK